MTSDQIRGNDGGGSAGASGSRSRTIVEYAVLAIVAIAVALLIQAFLVKPYRIPSESMENTLLIGDRVLVDRISWRFSEPQRGDITVFHPPFDGPVLIKRIIGMPGDVLSLNGGSVYVNGSRLDEPYVRRVGGRPVPSEPF
ncbi:MAG TPA: signal peptidase I, partial [Thermoleophilia bacterium]